MESGDGLQKHKRSRPKIKNTKTGGQLLPFVVTIARVHTLLPISDL